jgi:hypothetical protein
VHQGSSTSRLDLPADERADQFMAARARPSRPIPRGQSGLSRALTCADSLFRLHGRGRAIGRSLHCFRPAGPIIFSIPAALPLAGERKAEISLKPETVSARSHRKDSGLGQGEQLSGRGEAGPVARQPRSTASQTIGGAKGQAPAGAALCRTADIHGKATTRGRHRSARAGIYDPDGRSHRGGDSRPPGPNR